MKREDWQKAYAPVPDALSHRVSSTLSALDKEEAPVRTFSFRTVLITLAILLVLGGVAFALIESRTIDFFGGFYGDDFKENLMTGDVAISGQTHTVGDVVYTLDDVVYVDGALYGTGHMTVAEGKNVVLIAEEYQMDDPAGYNLIYGGPEVVVPDDAPSYGDLASERGAKLLLPICEPDGVVMPDGSLGSHGSIGYTYFPQEDGSVQFSFELTDERVEPADSYTIRLSCSNWEVTQEGEWLREEPNNTWLKETWDVTVKPSEKAK